MDAEVQAVDVADAQETMAALHASGLVERTPLIKLRLPPGQERPGVEVWLKLECLQPIGSFKVRGAAAALLASESDAPLACCSAGNFGQALALVARERGVACTIIVPEQAPEAKLRPMRELGGVVVKVPFARWWEAIEQGAAAPAVREAAPNARFVHPVVSPDVIRGNASVGLEVLEQLPDVDCVLVPYGGGGLAAGVASVMSAIAPSVAVVAVEPSTAAPVAASFAAGRRCERFEGWEPSFVDGCGGKAVLPCMWPLVSRLLAGAVAVDPSIAAQAVALLATRAKIVAEGAGACTVAAAALVPELLPPRARRARRIVCVVSGGCIDVGKLIQCVGGCPEAAAGGTVTAGCLRRRSMSMWPVAAAAAVAAVATAVVLKCR